MYISVKKKKTSPGISGLAGLVFISSKAKKNKVSLISKGWNAISLHYDVFTKRECRKNFTKQISNVISRGSAANPSFALIRGLIRIDALGLFMFQMQLIS